MKTKAYLRRLWIGLLPVLLVGCAASRTARTVVVSPVETLTRMAIPRCGCMP